METDEKERRSERSWMRRGGWKSIANRTVNKISIDKIFTCWIEPIGANWPESSKCCKRTIELERRARPESRSEPVNSQLIRWLITQSTGEWFDSIEIFIVARLAVTIDWWLLFNRWIWFCWVCFLIVFRDSLGFLSLQCRLWGFSRILAICRWQIKILWDP